jgi:prepilin-type N-terminal cleavage/methylation domain-containing protein
MELKRKAPSASQRGMSLIELMIASFVLTVGVLGCAAVIPLAIGTNFKNRQQSNSTVIAQMTMEKISSASAGGSAALIITDCLGAANTINIIGSTAGTGAALLSTGSADFSRLQGSSGAPAGYYMSYTSCGTSGRQSIYDVRWNVQTPSSYVSLVTVSAKMKSSGTNPNLLSLPVTIRTIVGGS